MGLIRKGSSDKKNQSSQEPFSATSPPQGASTAASQGSSKRILGGGQGKKLYSGSHLPDLETVTVGGDNTASQPVTTSSSADDINGLLTNSGSEIAPVQQEAPAIPTGPPVNEQVLAEARAEAEQIVMAAQQEAQQYVQQTMAQAEEQARVMAEQAQQEGYQLGLTQGQAEAERLAQEALTEQMREGISLYNQAVQEYKRVLSQAEGQVVDFALVVVKKLLGQVVEGSQEAAFGLVEQAIRELQDREEVVVKVHPDMVDYVRERESELQKMIEGLKSFKVLGDPNLELGDCLLETNLGNIDARLSIQLDAIDRALQETKQLRAQELAEKLEQEEPLPRELPVIEEPEAPTVTLPLAEDDALPEEFAGEEQELETNEEPDPDLEQTMVTQADFSQAEGEPEAVEQTMIDGAVGSVDESEPNSEPNSEPSSEPQSDLMAEIDQMQQTQAEEEDPT